MIMVKFKYLTLIDMGMTLPDMRKPRIGEEFSGVLTGTPRTIRGIVVIDVEDDNGKQWTSPTASKLSELIVKATYQTGLLQPGYRVWWACEGELPSRRGKPYKEFSIRITSGKETVFEHLVIHNQAYRKMVRAG